MIRFGKRGKLNPHYIGTFRIIAKVGTLAYQLKLLEQLSRVYSTFHVSNLKKCFVDEPLAIPLDEIQIDDKLYFIEEPVEIMDREVKRLKQSLIPIVKLLLLFLFCLMSSEESVGSHAPRVILFGAIPAIIPAIPEVPIVLADPIVTPEVEDSLLPLPDLHWVAPLFCVLMTTEADGESEPAEQTLELAWRRVSHHSSDRHSSSDSSSSRAPLDHSLSRHTPPDTTDADSSTPQRFVYRSLARTPLHSGEEHMEVRYCADADGCLQDLRLGMGVVAHHEDGVGLGFEIDGSVSFESSRGGYIPDLEDTIYDIVHYMSEVLIDMITKIETTQRQLETSQMVASGERASLVERIRSLRLKYLKVRAMLSIERDRIDSLHWHMALSQEEFHQVRRDRDDTRRRLRRWFEKMETVFHISNCPEKSQVKYATCTLLNSALTWWNSHKRNIGTEAAFAMS
ncbi:hypothetical protein Tco_0654135 [Tanacetum coccineum]|uniref:Tf2-1-like SH3-like domain-containing protein n=1 Tax=Tanacetum coccineum TaxID=301880 RepID=A0ABQ4X2D4_9ASTR